MHRRDRRAAGRHRGNGTDAHAQCICLTTARVQRDAARLDLQRRARRLVSLNPLLNQPGFTPAAQGMQAAMPHLDLLATGADLAEIERILPALIDALR